MKNLTTFSQLEVQFQISDFVEKTIFQINKDLNGLVTEVLEVNLKGSENKLEKLKSKLSILLEQLDRSSHLQQFIYQVDLNEKQWVAFLATQKFSSLAEEIIIREAQKVYLRLIFKNT